MKSWVEQCKLEEHRNLGVKGKSGVLASRDSCGVPVPVRGFGQCRQQGIDHCCDRRRVLDQTPIADPQEPAQGITLGEEVFINHLYGGRDEPVEKIIDLFICKLRKKLANVSGGKDCIETVRRPRLCAT
jgi:hypothetical protein